MATLFGLIGCHRTELSPWYQRVLDSDPDRHEVRFRDDGPGPRPVGDEIIIDQQLVYARVVGDPSHDAIATLHASQDRRAGIISLEYGRRRVGCDWAGLEDLESWARSIGAAPVSSSSDYRIGFRADIPQPQGTIRVVLRVEFVAKRDLEFERHDLVLSYIATEPPDARDETRLEETWKLRELKNAFRRLRCEGLRRW